MNIMRLAEKHGAQVGSDIVTLEAAVRHHIFCPDCRKVMDQRSAVLIVAGPDRRRVIRCGRACAEKGLEEFGIKKWALVDASGLIGTTIKGYSDE